MPTGLTEAARKEMHEGVLKARRFAEHWHENAAELMKRYGGQWVLFLGTRVVAHEVDPNRLEKARKRLDEREGHITLRYVPRPDERFVL